MNFNEVVGQKDMIQQLTAAIKNGKTGHAYIFCGPRGVGKRTVARIFAGLLLCEAQNSRETCGRCMACRTLENGSNPDFFCIDPGDESIGVEAVRDIQSEIVMKPLYSPKKVYLILDAHKMTPQAQNCLLKTLEEPPPYAVLILTTSNYEAMLGTIRSRALKYVFQKNTPAEVRNVLEKRLGHSVRDMDFIISYAGGIVGTALELAGSNEFSELREKTIGLALNLSKSQLADIFDFYKFFEENKPSIENVLDILLLFYRDVFMVKKAYSENILINSDKKDIIKGNVSAWSDLQLVRNIEIIEQTRKNLKYNANYQLSIEVMLMKLREEYHSW